MDKGYSHKPNTKDAYKTTIMWHETLRLPANSTSNFQNYQTFRFRFFLKQTFQDRRRNRQMGDNSPLFASCLHQHHPMA